MAVFTSTGPCETAPPLSSGIKIIIVGLGIGGLATAIECHRKGHRVVAFDKYPIHTETFGDLLGLSTNSARVLKKWDNGKIHESLVNIKNAAPAIEICDTAGKTIMPADMTGYKKEDGYWVLRSTLASTFYNHARSLGVEMHIGPDSSVTDFWETEDQAGVVVNNEHFGADCVVCCDGLNSRARQMVLHEEPPLRPTNEYAFRTSFRTEELRKDSTANWILDGMDQVDRGKVWKGRGLEIGFSSFDNGQSIVLVAICNCDLAREKLARIPNSLSDVMEMIKDWPIQPDLAAVVKYIPEDRVIHHSLALRDPLKTWISAGGRTIVTGDAAHSYLPILGQGGSQAIEDAAVLAITLELSRESRVPLALKVAEAIRKPRATTISEASMAIHFEWYNQDWDAVAKDPTLLKGSRPGWILSHDCQEYTYQEYEKVVLAMERGEQYVPTNIPKNGDLGLSEKMTA